jgi:hypothetical protein
LLPWVALVVLAVGFLNFLWFLYESSTIGDAQRGYIVDGHYYLVHAGLATEVTKAAWDWSNFHAASLYLTHPLALAAIAYLLLTQAFPTMTGTNDAAGAQRVGRIRASGPPIASTRTGGKVGGLRATSPLVSVDVHPGGLVIKTLTLAPIGVEAANIIDVVPGRSFGTAMVRVVHREAGVPPDVRLYVKASSQVGVALRGLLPDRQEQAVAAVPETPPAIPAVEPYPPIMKAMIIVGFGLSLVFAAVSLPFAGSLSSFGLIWSVGLVLIIGYNAWKWFIRDRHRW